MLAAVVLGDELREAAEMRLAALADIDVVAFQELQKPFGHWLI